MTRFASIACIGLVVALLGSACGDSGLGAGGAGSCAAILHLQGRTYMGLSTAISPRRTGRLGSGQFPACNDTGVTAGHNPHPSVYRLQGVPPTQGILKDTFVFV